MLINLIGNAIKFTEKGSVELRCHTIRMGEQRSLSIRFEVVDTGIGIHTDAQARIFENFSQADESTNQKIWRTGPVQQLPAVGGTHGRAHKAAKHTCRYWLDILV